MKTNAQRSLETRTALIDAARKLFVERSYAGAGTTEIVAAAGVTRGALYHHFADKEALFRAVIEAEAAAVAADIEAATPHSLDPLDALAEGVEAFFDAMTIPGRTRLLFIDGPAVFGQRAMAEIDARHGGRTLRDGLQMAMAAGVMRPVPLDATAGLLSAAFERAAIEIGAGGNPEDYRDAIAALINGLVAPRA